MAGVRGFAVCTVLFVLGGSLPCISAVCTQTSIRDCEMSIKFQGGFCTYFDAISDCLDDVKSHCTDDWWLAKINEQLALHRASSMKCPGMSASCFYDAKTHCMRNVPYNVKTVTNYSEENKIRDCKKFQGKDSEAEECLKGLKKQCNSPGVDRHVDASMETLVYIQEYCGKLNLTDTTTGL